MVAYDDWSEKPVPMIDSESAPYWEAAHDGELVVQRCRGCGERQFYPRRVCRHCGSRDLTLEAVTGTGTVYSFTRVHVAGQPGYDDDTPYVVALVELDLPAENPSGRPIRLTTHITGTPDTDVAIGQPVTVSFEPISDDPAVSLPVFTPE